MPNITLRFTPEMRQAIYGGRKCCTARNEPKGAVGDTFVIGARDYRIIDVQEQALNDVARLLYRQEGFESPGEFIMFWKSLHLGDPYLPWRTVHVHWFARVEQEADAR
jgi:hypothetical protein